MRKVTLLFILLAIVVTACKASPTPIPAETDSFDAVRAHIKRLVAEGEVPSMAVAVARDGEIVRDTSGPYALYRFLFEDYHCDTEPITVRHHLTHTSQGVPGEAYRYNGFLYGLLSRVAEAASEEGFADLLVGNHRPPRDDQHHPQLKRQPPPAGLGGDCKTL